MVSIGSDLSTRFLELPKELLQQKSEPELSARFQGELSSIFHDVETLRFPTPCVSSNHPKTLEQRAPCVPGLGIGERLLFFRDYFALRCHFCVHFRIVFPLVRNVILVEYRFDWAFGDASFAVDALIRVDVEHLFPFVKAFHGTYDHAICITASNTWLRHNVCHLFSLPYLINMRLDSFVVGTMEKIAAIAYYRQISSNFPPPAW